MLYTTDVYNVDILVNISAKSVSTAVSLVNYTHIHTHIHRHTYIDTHT